MKVIAIVLSLVCISSARNIKWSPEKVSEIEGDREVKEHIQKYWPELGEVLGENDEQKVKEFLHQVFEMYRPIHGASDEIDQDTAEPSKEFPHKQNLRPSHHGQIMVKPFPHKDLVRPLDGASSEIVDQEIVRPHKHNMRPLHAEHNEEMEKPVPQKLILRPLHAPPAEHIEETVPEELIMRPLDVPVVELDEEMEKWFGQMHILRPQEAVSGEIKDQEMMKPFPYIVCNMRPQHSAPVEIDEEKLVPEELTMSLHASSAELNEEMEKSVPQKLILRPLHDHPVEFDGETENSFPQMHILQPQEAVSREIMDQEMMKPYKYNKRPQHSLPVEIEGEMEESLPNYNIMSPLYAPGIIDTDKSFSNEKINKKRPSHSVQAEDIIL